MKPMTDLRPVKHLFVAAGGTESSYPVSFHTNSSMAHAAGSVDYIAEPLSTLTTSGFKGTLTHRCDGTEKPKTFQYGLQLRVSTRVRSFFESTNGVNVFRGEGRGCADNRWLIIHFGHRPKRKWDSTKGFVFR